jgi:hypothetical protein
MKYIYIFLLLPALLSAQTTVIYDTIQDVQIGQFRQGYYLVDGVPGFLAPGQIELDVRYSAEPTYEPETDKLLTRFERRGKEYVQVYSIEPKTQEEIDADFKASVPLEITKRQAALGMVLYLGIDPSQIEAFISQSIPNETQKRLALIEWQYTSIVSRSNPLIGLFAQYLSLSERQIDEFFINCEKNL